MQGRYLPLPVVYHKDYDTAKGAFILYHKLYFARALVYVILMLLPFFEVRLQIQTALVKGKCFFLEGIKRASVLRPFMMELDFVNQ